MTLFDGTVQMQCEIREIAIRVNHGAVTEIALKQSRVLRVRWRRRDMVATAAIGLSSVHYCPYGNPGAMTVGIGAGA